MSKIRIGNISADGAELDESRLADIVGGAMMKVEKLQPTTLKLESGDFPDRTLPGDPRNG